MMFSIADSRDFLLHFLNILAIAQVLDIPNELSGLNIELVYNWHTIGNVDLFDLLFGEI